ncbi:MAG: endonuclease/exonuclease/phosphatase family protein [Bacteroidales bacterium]|nr:endonuclease/exonuclease/phosphatase family protein [Bacteroidales bacterium]
MKFKSIILSLVLPAVLATTGAQAQDRQNRAFDKDKECSLRLMSYNVRNAKGMDKLTNYSRIASVIADTAPDAVAVQEVDSCTSRSNGFNVIAQLAKGTGLQWTFAPAIDYDGGKYGIGMLSRKAPISVKTVPLPGREEKRVLLIAEFDSYYYCCTHLSLTAEDRMSSLEIILKEMAGLNAQKDIFIAGDFNAAPSSEFIARMAEHFDFLTDPNVFTFPADKPDRTIDYIARYKAAGHSFKPERSSILEESVASDHRPAVCELVWMRSPKMAVPILTIVAP